jgi:hypothetical protein
VYLMCFKFLYFFNVFVYMHFIELSHASPVLIFESTHKLLG